MPNPVIVTVSIAAPVFQDFGEVQQWASALGRVIIEAIQQHGHRLNASIHQDGGIPMTNPLILAPFTVATLPAAADWEGGIIYVSDGAAGAKFRGSDNTTWVNLG